MLPKDIVYRAIERRDPPRTPLNYCNRDFADSDTASLGYAAVAQPEQPGATEWGYVWERLDDTMGQPVTHPLADWSRIDEYRPPDPYAAGRLAHLPEQLAALDGKFTRFGLGISGFNQATFLRGFAALLMDLSAEPAHAARVLELVFDFENAIIAQLAPVAVDAVCFADDWGTQQGLMIAPALWREVFRPRYAEQFAEIHRQGKKVWFHSCGNVAAILGDLIDIGVDVLELLQPDIFGVEWLGREYGGHVCFCCAVDHQRLAIQGTREEIFAYARRLHAALGRFHGGFIGYLEDYASLGMNEQHYQWIRAALISPTPRVRRKRCRPSSRWRRKTPMRRAKARCT